MVMSYLLVPHLPSFVTMVAKAFMCKRKENNLIFISIYFYFFYSIFLFFLLKTKVNNTKCKKVKCSLIFVSGKKAILSHERHAYFGSEVMRATRCNQMVASYMS